MPIVPDFFPGSVYASRSHGSIPGLQFDSLRGHLVVASSLGDIGSLDFGKRQQRLPYRTSHLNRACMKRLKARWILPISSPPIHNGWVETDGNRILNLGVGRSSEPFEDLGDVAILPQLVNAHTHLEFSHLDAPLGAPGINLCDWIGLAITAREGDLSRDQSIELGLRQSEAFGVSLIGEITTPPCEYAKQNPSTATVCCFAETLGLTSERADARFRLAMEQTTRDSWCGLSPHAPYSTTRDTIAKCVEISSTTGRPLAMHIAESPAERQLLESGRGPFVMALQRLGIDPSGLFPWGGRPIEELIAMLARSSRALLVHANDLQATEIQRLARYHHLSVVYCPRTHAYFGYDPHPVAQLLEVGVRVALGTDSRASNPDLSVWGEVQFLLSHRTDLAPQAVLEMATLNGADALGYPRLGRIEIGGDCLLGAFDSAATTLDQVYRDAAENPFRPLLFSYD